MKRTYYQIDLVSGPILLTESQLREQLGLAKTALNSARKGSAKYKLWRAYHNKLLRFKEVRRDE